MKVAHYVSNTLKAVIEMASVWEFLINQLVAREIFHAQIPEFIEDVFSIIGNGGDFTTRFVNARLERLGWGPEVLDEATFQLIVYILKSEWVYRVRHYMIHE